MGPAFFLQLTPVCVCVLCVCVCVCVCVCAHTDAHVDTCNTGMEIKWNGFLGHTLAKTLQLYIWELGQGCADLTYLVSMKETVSGLEDSCTPVPMPCSVGMEEGVKKKEGGEGREEGYPHVSLPWASEPGYRQ